MQSGSGSLLEIASDSPSFCGRWLSVRLALAQGLEGAAGALGQRLQGRDVVFLLFCKRYLVSLLQSVSLSVSCLEASQRRNQ